MLRPRLTDVHRDARSRPFVHIDRETRVSAPSAIPPNGCPGSNAGGMPAPRATGGRIRAMTGSASLSWTLEPGVLIGVAIVGGAYVARWRAVRAGNTPRPAADAPVWRLCCFLGAQLVTLIALVSPIDALADQLFLMHMVQHVLLLDVVP